MPEPRFYSNEAFNPRRKVGRDSDVHALLSRSRELEESITTSTRPDIFREGGLLSGWQANMPAVEAAEAEADHIAASITSHPSQDPRKARFSEVQRAVDRLDARGEVHFSGTQSNWKQTVPLEEFNSPEEQEISAQQGQMQLPFRTFLEEDEVEEDTLSRNNQEALDLQRRMGIKVNLTEGYGGI